MKLSALLLFALFVSMPAYGGNTRNTEADQLISSDHTKTYPLPSTADTLAGSTVSNYGTGATSFTLNGMLYGNSTSAIQVTSAGSQYQVFQAGASGVPTVGALHLDQSAAITGALGVGNGGTGSTSTPSAGQLLVGNGSVYTTATPTQEVFSVQCNSSATAYTLSNTPNANALVSVYLDGSLLRQGSGLDYTISGATITLGSACATGQILYGVYTH